MSKTKCIVLEIISVALAFAVSLWMWAFGKTAPFGSPDTYTIIFSICVSLIGLFTVANIVATIVRNRRMNKMNVRETYGMLDDVKADMETDLNKARRRVERTFVLMRLYWVMLVLLFAASCFSAGGTQYTDLSVPFVLVSTFFLWGIVDMPFFSPTPASPDNYVLSRNEYAELYDLASSAAKELRINKNIKLIVHNEGISVTESGGDVVIMLGYLATSVLTRDELYAVLLHEMAHIAHSDSVMTAKFDRLLFRYDCGSYDTVAVTALPKIMFFTWIHGVAAFETEMMTTLISKSFERAADGEVKKRGKAQDLINALSKSAMAAFYSNMSRRELDFDYWAPESSTKDYARRELKLFYEYREKYGDKWKHSLAVELPARVDTHPIFRDRMSELGCENYDAYTRETDCKYLAELDKLIDRADKIIAETTDHAAAHKAYTERKQNMDKYEEAKQSGEELTNKQLNDACIAYYGVDDDKALAIADEMEKKGMDEAFLAKGLVYRSRDDDRCIECFRALSEKPCEYTFFAHTQLGEYALETGNQALLDAYRASAPDKLQTVYDSEEQNRFKKSTPTEPCDLDRETIEDIAAKLAEASNDRIKNIYICKYTDSYGKVHYPLAYTFFQTKIVTTDDVFTIFNAVWEKMSEYGDYPDIMPCNIPQNLARKVKMTPGSLVYTAEKKKKK